MSENSGDNKKKDNKKQDFDPEKKLSDEADDSFSSQGWLRDEKWSILTDNSDKPLLLADGGDADADADAGSGMDDGGSASSSCKSCSTSSSSSDGN